MTALGRIDRFATWILAAALALVPIIHSGRLAQPFTLPKEIVIQAAALLLLAAAILSRLFERSATRLGSPVLLLSLLLVAAGGLALAPAQNPALAARGLASLAAGVVILWGVARHARAPAAATRLARVSLGAAALVALGSLLQVFSPGFHLTLGGLSILPPGGAGSTLGDTGLATQYLLLALPFGIGALSAATGAAAMLWGGCLGLVASALLYAGRPEGWVVAAGCAVLLLATRALRAARGGIGWRGLVPDLGSDGVRAALSGAIVIVAVVSIARLPALSGGLRAVPFLQGVSLLVPASGDPDADRAAAARSTAALLKTHPMGVGLQTWRHAVLEVVWTGVPDSPFSLSHQPHHAGNSFLEMAAETGVAGGLAFVLLLAALLTLAFSTATAQPGGRGDIGFACFNTLAVFTLMSFLGSPLQEPAPALIFWIVAGLALVSAADSKGLPARLGWLRPVERPDLPKALRRRLPLWAGAIGWGALAIFGGLRTAERLNASSLTFAAQTAAGAGRHEAAIAALDQPAALRSPEPLPHALAGEACLRLGLYSQATDAFTRALARSPHDPAGYMGRAAAYEAAGRYDLADQDLRTALGIWPRGREIVMALGRLNTRRGRLETGFEFYGRASQIDPSVPEAYFRMGEVLMRLGRLDDAIAALRACGLKDPRYPGLKLALGDAHYEKGLYDLALQYYQAAAQNDPKAIDPLLKMANTLHSLGRTCDALDALRSARDLETEPARREAILTLIDRVEPVCRSSRKK